MQRFRTSGVLKVPNYPVPVGIEVSATGAVEETSGRKRAQGLTVSGMQDIRAAMLTRDSDRKTVSAKDVDRPFR